MNTPLVSSPSVVLPPPVEMQSAPIFAVFILLVAHSFAGYSPEERYNQDERYNQGERYNQEDVDYARYGKGLEDELKDYYETPHYTYEYKVDDYKNGDFKRHRESREGGAVKGYYSLMDADGSVRTVHYTADDKNGFNAIVTKSEPQEEHLQHQQNQLNDEQV